MDEGLLNDLLECSVCLERLDTSSRVLPCQHTFCLKCLKVIVESHKELRCPECRILVETKVEDLPPNVLLMRILEGMRNSAPKKVVGVGQRIRAGHLQVQQGSLSARDGKQLPPHARAVYDYISKEPGDLSFKKGEIILLQKKLDAFWYQGECSGRTGMFPITFVQVVVQLPAATALCKALYDFRMSAPDEEGCLAFDKGAIITVHRRVDDNWAEGRLENRVGIFPIAFVELNQAARQLINCAPLNRPVPPVPGHARPGHSEHRHHSQHPHRYQPMSVSTPATSQGNYQNMATMTQSHPNYPTAMLVQQPQTLGPHAGLLSTPPRNILEQQSKHAIDLIHFSNKGHGVLGLQSVSRIGEVNYDRTRVKFDYSSTPADSTYQNVRPPVSNNPSSDSSSSMNTPSVGVSSNTTPNTSSDTSTCESNEPSLPSSPDNNTDRTAAVNGPDPDPDRREPSLNTSMGILSLNESSTATNTSLNVSLPPSESPKPNASNEEAQETEEVRLDAPSSSKVVIRSSGPDSLLNFGLGLQAALSPSHGQEGNYVVSRSHRDPHREREKRHSLTPSTHLQANHNTPNRHSAEIVATSLLDAAPVGGPCGGLGGGTDARARRRRRSRSSERPLPAHYVALYPYHPQKPDELELTKGVVYTVTERCRDGWYKGFSERSQRAGVFPGNYVAPHRTKHDKSVVSTVGTVPSLKAMTSGPPPPPDAPPRAPSPSPLLSAAQPLTYPWNSTTLCMQQTTPRSEKSRDKTKAEKSSISSGVSLMKRWAAMKKCKSPPPAAAYSIDNPVFEDGPSRLLDVPLHPHHVRSTNESPWQTQHRKSQSLDVTAARKDRHHSQTVKERYRCIVPYPPNSEYELELKVDDIVIVSKKRGDGWYKGTLQRTGRTGLFPASFVQSCPHE
ncbi:E3 ubiquitin-protein ligase SH3RF1 isoform X2 [Bombyx mandarina]|uniref:RING-type E3 ubiquitin transferase n=1 Tax=Bombyx mandarina TaxID=7092 RepID=A0A6J2JH55_BOMMA|nr:E3 ubiquitin-protein ligase SH3RF1 isoform X2 [Bombyx mandarina]